MKQKLILLILFSATIFGCSNSDNKINLLSNPASEHSSFPYLHANGGSLYMSWITSSDQGHTLQYARYANQSWSAPITIAQDSSWFVNWADFPSIIANSKEPVAAHWLNKIPGGPYAYNIKISTASSVDQWSSPITPHQDGTATEHGFVSMIPWDDATILAIWLDGRRTAHRPENEYYDIDKAMTLRGALISTDGNIKEKFLIDDSVCDCCQTSLIKTSDGAVVAYRNRTDDEIRDIYLSRFNGNVWSEPDLVHEDGWKIGACPVNGPKLAAIDSTVLVAWHSGASNNPSTKAAISADAGNNFDNPITFNNNESLGRVDAALTDNNAFVSWMEKDGDKANLQVASYGRTDTSFTTLNIDRINSSRQTGFPQMEVVGDKIIFAWTDVDSAASQIKTKSLSLE
jgi:hypothetical protein